MYILAMFIKKTKSIFVFLLLEQDPQLIGTLGSFGGTI